VESERKTRTVFMVPCAKCGALNRVEATFEYVEAKPEKVVETETKKEESTDAGKTDAKGKSGKDQPVER